VLYILIICFLKNFSCFDFLVSSDNFSLLSVVCDDMRMYLVRIILLQKDYCGSISAVYFIYFGRYIGILSVLKFTFIMLVSVYEEPNCYFCCQSLFLYWYLELLLEMFV